jgi:hypothetical protein
MNTKQIFDQAQYKREMKILGKFLYYSGSAKFYYDGDGLGFVWRWYHPFAWIFVPLLFSIQALLVGVPNTWKYRHGLGIGMNPFFKKNPEKLMWLK